MKWIKQVVVDLLATAVIAIAVLFPNQSLTYIVYIYTGLMVIARTISLVSDNFQKITSKKVSEAPIWFHHTLYAANVALLAYGGWFITASAWVFIWAVAAYVHKRSFKP